MTACRTECLSRFPTGKYQVIYADPPWSYDNNGAVDGKPQYPVMTLDALKALPVDRVADSTCVLFLWATNPLLPEALDLIRAWGFTYKTVMKVWLKRAATGNPVMSVGWWSRPSTELLLVATRGGGYMKWKTTHSEPQEHASPRGRHSEKPLEIRDRLRDFMAVPKRLELFARTISPGWDAWGLEIQGYFHKTTTKGVAGSRRAEGAESRQGVAESRQGVAGSKKTLVKPDGHARVGMQAPRRPLRKGA